MYLAAEIQARAAARARLDAATAAFLAAGKTITPLPDQVAAAPQLNEPDSARELSRIRKETSAAMAALERLEKRARRTA